MKYYPEIENKWNELAGQYTLKNSDNTMMNYEDAMVYLQKCIMN